MDEHKKHHQKDDDGIYDHEEFKTTHEILREVHGNPDYNLNALPDETDEAVNQNRDVLAEGAAPSDVTRGVDYTPNDASAVRSGGTTDMDDQTGDNSMGLQTGSKTGIESGIAQKRNVTGSDFDGQNSTSNP